MEEETRENLVSREIWIRGLYMVLFAIAYSIAKVIIVFIAVFQFLAVLFTGGVNEPLLQFGKNLSIYIFEILEFQTFNTELRPFPYSPWPDEEPGGEEWLEEEDDEPAVKVSTAHETDAQEVGETDVDHPDEDSPDVDSHDEDSPDVDSPDKDSPDKD
ncbi:MAG: lipase [Gammaproteobacteria bacterium]|nr:lipase [Gammaproteobacteria bacterium]